MSNPNAVSFIQKAINGHEVLFKNIPNNRWDVFWDTFEIEKRVTFNEDYTGIVKKRW